MIKLVWKIYTKISNYDQKIKDEFEYELMKNLEARYYNLWKYTEKNKANYKTDRESEKWLSAYDSGRTTAFKDVWNDIHDKYFHICKNLNRLDEVNALNASRNTDGQDETEK